MTKSCGLVQLTCENDWPQINADRRGSAFIRVHLRLNQSARLIAEPITIYDPFKTESHAFRLSRTTLHQGKQSCEYAYFLATLVVSLRSQFVILKV